MKYYLVYVNSVYDEYHTQPLKYLLKTEHITDIPDIMERYMVKNAGQYRLELRCLAPWSMSDADNIVKIEELELTDIINCEELKKGE